MRACDRDDCPQIGYQPGADGDRYERCTVCDGIVQRYQRTTLVQGVDLSALAAGITLDGVEPPTGPPTTINLGTLYK